MSPRKLGERSRSISDKILYTCILERPSALAIVAGPLPSGYNSQHLGATESRFATPVDALPLGPFNAISLPLV
jgi:hypothetical protein